ncbi:MAG TPA: hypothetical protein VGE29_06140 [Prosthecobacter sp.]
MSEVPPSPRQLFHQLDVGSISPEQFRAAMALHAQEAIVEMEEDHLNPAAAFLEQMRCRRLASKLLKKHEETVIREVLIALADLSDFPPGRQLWNAAHPHIPLHAFFRSHRRPVFRIISLDALPQMVTTVVEYGSGTGDDVVKEEFRLRRDRRNQLGLERRRLV